jgi:hypothetical protein
MAGMLKVWDGTVWRYVQGVEGPEGPQGPTGPQGETGPAGPTATQEINTQTSTSYTLVLTDAQKLVTLNNAAAVTLTVPPNSAVAFPVGTSIDLVQLGAGAVTIAGGSGVTVNAAPSKVFDGQYAGATLKKLGADTWVAVGRFAP